MSIRAIPLDVPDTEPGSEMMAVEEVAERMALSGSTVRAWMRKDMKDGRQRIPGGRCEGSRYVIVRAVFERAMRHGQEPERTPILVAPDLADIVTQLRQRAADDLELAGRIEAATHAARQHVA